MSFKEKEDNSIIIDPAISALIFDCDGTLVDSMPTHMEAWEYAFKHFNARYDEDFLFSFKGMKDTDIVELYNKAFGTALNAEAVASTKIKYFIQNLKRFGPFNRLLILCVRIIKNFRLPWFPAVLEA